MCWHKWGKWFRGGDLYEAGCKLPYGFYQIRVCLKCNKSQMKKVEV